jgi:hypothetical protein
VSQDEWLAARRDLLNEEKELTKQQQRVAAARRELPWVKVTKEYVFDTPKGKLRLADLFAGRSQLIIKHNMLNPKHDVCVGCSIEMDSIEGARVIWSITTCRSWPCRARRWHRFSRHSNEWAGRLHGCRPMTATSTMTFMSPSGPMTSLGARCSTTTR